MLQALREKMTGWVALVVIGLMIIPFAFFGVGDYFSARGENWIAKVGDREIAPEQLRRRIDEFRNQMRSMMGEAFDARYFEQPEVRRQVLDRLIEEEVLMQAAADMGLEVPAQRLRDEIAGIQAFQVDGAFNQDQYARLLNAQGMSASMFQDRMLRDIIVREFPGEIAASSLVTDAEVDRYLALNGQLRDFRYLRLAAPEMDESPLEDEAVRAWYEANLDRYMQPEQVTIEYVELTEEGLDVGTEISETELRRRYEEQRARFVEEAQRLVSHILVQVASDADAETQRAALERANGLAAMAREEGADFAALAREHSEDVGSAALGGEIGWIERGMTHAAFEDAAFAAESGAVTDPVLSPEGYHVILVNDVRDERSRSFEEVRADLERELLEGERERRFAEISGELMDLVFRDPTSLAPVADGLDLEIQTEGPFGRMSGTGIAAHPEVLRVSFSDQVLINGLTSDPIETEPGRVVVLRVREHTPARPREFDEVRELVEASMRSESRDEAAKARAEALLARLKGGEASLDAIATEIEAEVVDAGAIGRGAVNIEAAVRNQVFRMPRPTEDDPRFATAALPGAAYALVELRAVRDADPATVDEAQRRQARETLAAGASNNEARAFIEALKSRATILVAEERML